MDDTSLLREYVENGSEPAFTRLVEQHLDLVYSAALRRVGGDHHRAKEVAQMVFTDLARKASQLKTHPLLAGWLHRSTRWAAASLRRTEQRRVAKELDAAFEHHLASATEASLAWDQISPLLDEALDALNEHDRDAVLLRFFNDQPFAAIGTQLGLSENAARMRVERALEKLHSLLAKRGVTSTAAVLTAILTQNSVSAAPAGLAPTITTTALSGASTIVGSVAGNLFMTKLQLALAGALTAALVVGLALQLDKNHRLQAQLAGLHAHTKTTQTAHQAAAARLAAQVETVRELDAALLVQAPPLTPEQQERVRLDTLIRKGELDSEYASLFRRLKLPPETLDKFKALLVERNQAIYDAVKLAKNQGCEPASYTEEKLIGESAVTEIDLRISALLGTSADEQFHDFLTLMPLRWQASDLASETKLSPFFYEAMLTPEFDAQQEKIARIIATSAPNLIDDNYRASGWPVDLPAPLLKALEKTLPAETMTRLKAYEAANASRRRMHEIAREAALQGKLKLSKSSARDYPAPNSTSSNPAK